METLHDFMARPLDGDPEYGQTGVESDWLFLAHFDLKGSKFLVADTDFIPEEDDGVVIRATAGKYLAQVKVMTFGNDRRISRLRVVLEGRSPAPQLGELLGETWPDSVGTGFCDLDIFKPVFDGLDGDDALEQICEVAWEQPGGVVSLAPGADMVFVQSGFGDGRYPIHELIDHEKRAGFEVEFIAPDTLYPLDAASAEDNDDPADIDGTAELVNRAVGVFREKFTGDEATDKKLLNTLFDDVLADLAKQADDAIDAYRENVLDTRHRPFATEMTLVAEPKGGWTKAPGAQRQIETLLKAGFVEAGCWRPESNDQMACLGFVRADNACASVTLMGGESVLSIQASFTDGSMFELTQTEKPNYPLPGWMRKMHVANLSPEEFPAEFDRLCPPGERAAVTAENYPLLVEDEFRRCQSWLMCRGGLTIDELKSVIPNLPEDDEEAAEVLQMTRLEQADLMLFRWLQQQPGLPFDPVKESERLHIIHEEMPPDMLANEWWCATADLKTRQDEFDRPVPRAAFAIVNAAKGGRLKLVYQKDTPLRADFYLR